jgi:serine/threonine protein kinase
MWSLGAVLFHVLCNNPPYIGRGDDKGAQMLRNIMTMEADFDPLRKCGVSEEGVDFISRLLNRDPSERPREKECFQHPWIVDVPDDELLEIELDDLDMEVKGLIAIDEADEEALDASRLNIQDDLGPIDFNSDDDELSADELAAQHYQPKRVRLGESRMDSQIQDAHMGPEIQYPLLPVHDEQKPGRLFGEITESALRSSGVLGQDTRAALAIGSERGEGSHDGRFHESNDEEITSNDGSVNHYLQYPQTLPIPSSLGGSAPSLLGAEALVGQLHMESPNSANSPVSTPNTNNPVTPETPKTRGASPGQSSHPHPSDTDSTPKVPRASRHMDFSAPQPPSNEHRPATQSTFDIPLESSPHNASQNGLDKHEDASPGETARTAEMEPNLDRQLGPYIIPDTNNEPSDEDDPHIQVPAPALATAVDSQCPSQGSGFAMPYRCLGKVVSLPGSFADVKFRLEHRLNSWGRGSEAMFQYPDPMDTRVPKYGLEITFWKPGIEQMIEDDEDWMQIADVFTIISTKTSKCIWVNDVELRSETPEKDHYYYGKIYTGDIITVYRSANKFLKFKVEIYHGLSTMVRPAGEEPFLIETAKAKNGVSNQ